MSDYVDWLEDIREQWIDHAEGIGVYDINCDECKHLHDCQPKDRHPDNCDLFEEDTTP